ncbi:hypothetical protein [Novacetimonas pomaceti]|uniref:hypothetical protein n=1 Tax=Novacetimonas pomaceti TaxID=2021998 RepID=UPI0026D9A850
MDLAPLPDIYRRAPFAGDCAPRRLLRLFSGKWTTMILHTLHLSGGASRPGPDSFSAIFRACQRR